MKRKKLKDMTVSELYNLRFKVLDTLMYQQSDVYDTDNPLAEWYWKITKELTSR